MSFGDRLQALRRQHGMTQEEFARQLKVSRQAVSKWESSRGYPELEKIIYICNCYGVTMDDLFLDEVSPARERAGADASAPREDPGPEPRSLKASFSTFFTNLTPKSQTRFTIGAAAVFLLVVILFCTSISKGVSNPMVYEIVWLVLLVVFALGEAATVGLTMIWFAAGALLALIVALLGGPLWLQIVLFILVSTACLLSVRPIARKYFNNKVEPTNADRVIGEVARVTEEIDNLRGTGAVVIGGIGWTARSGDDTVIPAGAIVRILRIEGVKVFVEKV